METLLENIFLQLFSNCQSKKINSEINIHQKSKSLKHLSHETSFYMVQYEDRNQIVSCKF